MKIALPETKYGIYRKTLHVPKGEYNPPVLMDEFPQYSDGLNQLYVMMEELRKHKFDVDQLTDETFMSQSRNRIYYLRKV